MAFNDYSGGKRKREADRQRKKHEKLERRQRAKQHKGSGIPIATVEEIQAGPMRDPDEAATQNVAPAQPRPRSRPGSARLFVGGLSWNTDETELRSTFSRCGTVTDAKILTDRDTGRSRGFGFVTMGSTDEAQRAIQELDGTQLDGRAIRVTEAVERPR